MWETRKGKEDPELIIAKPMHFMHVIKIFFSAFYKERPFEYQNNKINEKKNGKDITSE